MMAEMKEMTKHRQAQTGAGIQNEMEMEFDAVSDNESFARIAVAAFVSHLNPTLEELARFLLRFLSGSAVNSD